MEDKVTPFPHVVGRNLAPENAPGTLPFAQTEQYQKVLSAAHEHLLNSIEDERIDIDSWAPDTIARWVEVQTVSFIQEWRIPINEEEMQVVAEGLVKELTGFGPLDDLLHDPTIEDILINGFKDVHVSQGGQLKRAPQRFTDDTHLMRILRRILAPLGRRLDDSNPMVDARLPNGGRLNAIISPLAVDGPMVSIRKFRKDPFTPDELLAKGTFGDGIFRLYPDGRLRRNYAAAEGLPGGNIRAISVDASGVVWAGTQKGVIRIEGDSVRVSTLPGMPGGLITALEHDHQGNLWIGTIEGIRVLRGDHVQSIDLAPLGGGRSVFGFHQIGDAMWISSDRGLYRWQDGRLARVGLEQGMPVDAVFQLVPDRLGNVWISSNRGVLRTDMATLNAVADGRAPRVTVERYNEIDGMANAQANGSSGPSAILRQDGSFWVVTAGGLSTVDPQRLQRFRERPAPPAAIENVQVDGAPVHWEGPERNLVPGGRRLAVSYVGLSYLMSDRIRYRTRLDGLDSSWVERGPQRSVEFVGLPPGDYTLHVAASHPGGSWGQQEAVWSFTVEPFWWQRRSVQALIGLLLLAALVALYRFLLQQYKASNLRLARRVDEATFDLQAQTVHLQALNQEKTELAERLARQAEAFERQAREDALTTLANRRGFDEALARDFARAQRSGHPLCLVVLDIDHFKDVNDTYSHSIGDAVLVEVAQVIAAACRDSDLPARTGGEEFALLLNDTRLEEAAQLCARLRGLFHDHPDWAGVPGLRVTFSAGLVELDADDRTPALLYQRADRALYRAKSDGRDRTSIG